MTTDVTASTTDPAQAERDILATLIADQSVIDAILADPPAQRLVVLMQSTHLDWDWIVSNLQYFREGVPHWNNAAGSVRNILDSAVTLTAGSSGAGPGNRAAFSLAELGFLMHFLEREPARAAQIVASAPFFSLMGGAVETPDDLLPHGEAFIRTYFLTRMWAERTLPGTLSRYAWLPDDFGHTPCLPATFEAMGIAGFGFARCPGTDLAQNDGAAGPQLVATTPPSPTQQSRDVDFVWSTADGSTTQAHYLQNAYSQGDSTISGGVNQLAYILFDDPVGGGNANTVRLPYVMVPYGDDFGMPFTNGGNPPQSALLDLASQWNGSSQRGDTYAVCATFDQYMQLVAARNARSGGLQALFSPAPGAPAALTFWGTPYWTGFYATQPAVKNLHQVATRAMLAAESLAAIAGLEPAVYGTHLLQSNLDHGWMPIGISTSHNLLTGCGPDVASYAESVPFYRYAAANALALRRSLLESIANAIVPSQQPAVVLFNEIGCARTTGRVAVYRPDAAAPQSFSGVTSVVPVAGGAASAALPASDGTLHVLADVPALGYAQYTLSNAAAPAYDVVTRTEFSNLIALENAQVSVEISLDGAGPGQFLTVYDKATKVPIQHGLRVFSDSTGGIYRFGTEYGDALSDQTPAPAVVETSFVATSLLAIEHLAVTLGPSVYEVEITLASGDPYVGVAVRGSAGARQAVMASFQFASPIAGIAHGTPHGVNQELPPVPPGYGQNGPTTKAWLAPYFIPTHEYVAFFGAQAPLGAVLHSSVHAWSVQLAGQQGSLPAPNEALACLLRNAMGGGDEGASGADPGVHVARYAIRAGTGVPPAPSTQLVRESRAFAWPLAAVTPLTPAVPTDTEWPRVFSPAFSLASVDGDAVVNAAKIGSRKPTVEGTPPNTDEDLVLRIFTLAPLQPLTVHVPPTAGQGGFSVTSLQVIALNALEEQLTGAQQAALQIAITDTQTFTFVPQRVLTTLQVHRVWSGIPNYGGS
jgi:alpha-mannosidase